MVGYGQSDKPDGDVSLRVQAALLTRLVDSWGLDGPDVVAHDFGGAVALRAHLLHQMEISSLALLDVVALRPWGSPFFRLVNRSPDVFTALPANLNAALIREYINGASHHGLSPQVLEALAQPWLEEGQAAFYRQIAQADERHTDEVEPMCGNIRVPTLIVWGEEDNWLPLATGHRLARAIPNARLHIIEGAGHLIQEDRPTELNKILTRWLSETHGS